MALLVGFVTGCAARAPLRPGGPATPDDGAVAAFTEATAGCAGLRSLTVELRLSGRAGGERLRGRVLAGLDTGGALRLEGVAPFGPPLFILAGRDETATLWLPRDRRVLASAGVADVLARLTGVALGADDLRRVLTGCLADGTAATAGQRWSNGWRAVSVGADRTVFMTVQAGRSVIAAADYGAWHLDYAAVLNGRPRQVRIRDAAGAVDMTVTLQQLEMNVPIDAAAFTVAVPEGTPTITLDELRSVGRLKSDDLAIL